MVSLLGPVVVFQALAELVPGFAIGARRITLKLSSHGPSACPPSPLGSVPLPSSAHEHSLAFETSGQGPNGPNETGSKKRKNMVGDAGTENSPKKNTLQPADILGPRWERRPWADDNPSLLEPTLQAAVFFSLEAVLTVVCHLHHDLQSALHMQTECVCTKTNRMLKDASIRAAAIGKLWHLPKTEVGFHVPVSCLNSGVPHMSCKGFNLCCYYRQVVASTGERGGLSCPYIKFIFWRGTHVL